MRLSLSCQGCPGGRVPVAFCAAMSGLAVRSLSCRERAAVRARIFVLTNCRQLITIAGFVTGGVTTARCERAPAGMLLREEPESGDTRLRGPQRGGRYEAYHCWDHRHLRPRRPGDPMKRGGTMM